MNLSLRFNAESENALSKEGVQFIVPLIASVLGALTVEYQTRAETHEDGSIHIRTIYNSMGEKP
jgi:hypothetical protein